MRDALVTLMLAQAGGRESGPTWWIFLLIMASVLIVILYLFYRSQPPSGPRIGE